jgi:TonB family protein
LSIILRLRTEGLVKCLRSRSSRKTPERFTLSLYFFSARSMVSLSFTSTMIMFLRLFLRRKPLFDQPSALPEFEFLKNARKGKLFFRYCKPKKAEKMPGEKRDQHLIKKPGYPGGPKAMKAFISQNLRYPPEALEHQIEGSVYIKYAIGQRGEVTDAKVIAGLGYGCDEEALRLVRMLRFEVPKNRGLRVLFNKNIQIHFRLPKKPSTAPSPGAVTYSYTEKPKPNEQQGGYSYVIEL